MSRYLLKTRNIQTTKYKSIALSLEDIGAVSLTLLNILIRTRKRVTSRPILKIILISQFSLVDTRPARHHLGLDEEADPAGHHEHEAGEVNLDLFVRIILPRVNYTHLGSVKD